MRDDPGPQIVDPIKRRVQAISPDHLLAAAVGQFKGNGKSAPSDLNAAGEHIAHAQCRRDQRSVGIACRNRNDEPRAITASQRSRDKA